MPVRLHARETHELDLYIFSLAPPVLDKAPRDHDLLQVLLVVFGHADVLQLGALVVILDLGGGISLGEDIYFILFC